MATIAALLVVVAPFYIYKWLKDWVYFEVFVWFVVTCVMAGVTIYFIERHFDRKNWVKEESDETVKR